MKPTAIGLLAAAAFASTAFAGPEPRDRTTNKPSPEQCAAAARDGRTLPGCDNEGEVDEAQAPNGGNPMQPRDRYLVCPGDPRCPPR